MTDRKKTTPPAAHPRPGHQPGYAEPQPRDKDDARQRPPRQRSPRGNEGGTTPGRSR